MTRRILLLLAVSLLLASCAVPRVGIYKDPLSGEEHLKLGLAYEQKGEHDLARREYTEAARDIPQGHFYLGNLLFQQGDLAGAETSYRRALRDLPDDAAVNNNLAWLLFTRKTSLAEAEKLASKGVQLATPEQLPSHTDTLRKIQQLRSGK